MVDMDVLSMNQNNGIADFGIIHHFPTDGNQVYIKQMHLAAGNYVDTHKHNYDHFGLLGAGVARVRMGEESQIYEAPCVIEIKANIVHQITALTNVTWFCIHASEEKDMTKIDSTLIKEG